MWLQYKVEMLLMQSKFQPRPILDWCGSATQVGIEGLKQLKRSPYPICLLMCIT